MSLLGGVFLVRLHDTLPSNQRGFRQGPDGPHDRLDIAVWKPSKPSADDLQDIFLRYYREDPT